MEKSMIVVGLDESEHSFYAMELTLQQFFSPVPENSPFKLAIVHAKPFATSMGIVGPSAIEVLPMLDRDLKLIAKRVMEKAKEFCEAKQVHDVVLEVAEGDARNVLCDAVEKPHASILVVGSHGYGVIKMYALVSQLFSSLEFHFSFLVIFHRFEHSSIP